MDYSTDSSSIISVASTVTGDTTMSAAPAAPAVGGGGSPDSPSDTYMIVDSTSSGQVVARGGSAVSGQQYTALMVSVDPGTKPLAGSSADGGTHSRGRPPASPRTSAAFKKTYKASPSPSSRGYHTPGVSPATQREINFYREQNARVHARNQHLEMVHKHSERQLAHFLEKKKESDNAWECEHDIRIAREQDIAKLQETIKTMSAQIEAGNHTLRENDNSYRKLELKMQNSAATVEARDREILRLQGQLSEVVKQAEARIVEMAERNREVEGLFGSVMAEMQKAQETAKERELAVAETDRKYQEACASANDVQVRTDEMANYIEHLRKAGRGLEKELVTARDMAQKMYDEALRARNEAAEAKHQLMDMKTAAAEKEQSMKAITDLEGRIQELDCRLQTTVQDGNHALAVMTRERDQAKEMLKQIGEKEMKALEEMAALKAELVVAEERHQAALARGVPTLPAPAVAPALTMPMEGYVLKSLHEAIKAGLERKAKEAIQAMTEKIEEYAKSISELKKELADKNVIIEVFQNEIEMQRREIDRGWEEEEPWDDGLDEAPVERVDEPASNAESDTKFLDEIDNMVSDTLARADATAGANPSGSVDHGTNRGAGTSSVDNGTNSSSARRSTEHFNVATPPPRETRFEDQTPPPVNQAGYDDEAMRADIVAGRADASDQQDIPIEMTNGIKLVPPKDLKLPKAFPTQPTLDMWDVAIGKALVVSSRQADTARVIKYWKTVRKSTYEELANCDADMKPLDALLGSCLKTIMPERLKEKVDKMELEAFEMGNLLSGRQMGWLCFNWFKTEDNMSNIYSYNHLAEIKWFGDHRITEFLRIWDQIWKSLPNSKQIPDEVKRDLFAERVKESKVLKEDYAHYCRDKAKGLMGQDGTYEYLRRCCEVYEENRGKEAIVKETKDEFTRLANGAMKNQKGNENHPAMPAAKGKGKGKGKEKKAENGDAKGKGKGKGKRSQSAPPAPARGRTLDKTPRTDGLTDIAEDPKKRCWYFNKHVRGEGPPCKFTSAQCTRLHERIPEAEWKKYGPPALRSSSRTPTPQPGARKAKKGAGKGGKIRFCQRFLANGDCQFRNNINPATGKLCQYEHLTREQLEKRQAELKQKEKPN